MAALLSSCARRLFSSFLLCFDFSLHFHDQHCELGFTFLSRLRVDIPRDTLAIGVSWREPPFV